ncbi:hypothetical protein AHAS_Ahas05G0113000 [Arachis hypogaea]
MKEQENMDYIEGFINLKLPIHDSSSIKEKRATLQHNANNPLPLLLTNLNYVSSPPPGTRRRVEGGIAAGCDRGCRAFVVSRRSVRPSSPLHRAKLSELLVSPSQTLARRPCFLQSRTSLAGNLCSGPRRGKVILFRAHSVTAVLASPCLGIMDLKYLVRKLSHSVLTAQQLSACFSIQIENVKSVFIVELQWLDSIGVKNVCLYDMNGVLKKSKETIFGKLKNAKPIEEVNEAITLHVPEHMTLEFVSYADGKEAMVKAANFIFVENLKRQNFGGEIDGQVISEPLLNEALKVVGCKGPEPDLLLVYGPVRSHLGFPAWRIRYTEIVHMGSLNFMRYGSLIKAIYNFTKVRTRIMDTLYRGREKKRTGDILPYGANSNKVNE